MDGIIIGIDLGGTNLRIGAVQEDRRVRASRIIDSLVIARAEDPLEKLENVIRDFIRGNGIGKIDAVSIGVPSSVANDKETVICTTNLRNDRGEAVFQNVNMASWLRRRLQVPVFVNNDTKNILLYDVYANGLLQEDVVVGIYIGTVVGASVLIRGESLDGANGAALDMGHIPYYGGKERCSCGKWGCCECYASGWKLQKIRSEFYPDDEIGDLFLKHGEEKPLRELVRSCAHVFAVMATVFNPNTVIAGGGVIEMKGFPREEFERQVNRNTGLDVMSYGFRYVYSEPLAEKGVIGAAVFASQRLTLI